MPFPRAPLVVLLLAFALSGAPRSRGGESLVSPSPDGRFALRFQSADGRGTSESADLVRLPAGEPVLFLQEPGSTPAPPLVWSADSRLLAVHATNVRVSTTEIYRRVGEAIFTAVSVPEVHLPLERWGRVRRGRWRLAYLEPVRWLQGGDLLLSAHGNIELYDALPHRRWLFYRYRVILGVGTGERARVKAVGRAHIRYQAADT